MLVEDIVGEVKTVVVVRAEAFEATGTATGVTGDIKSGDKAAAAAVLPPIELGISVG